MRDSIYRPIDYSQSQNFSNESVIHRFYDSVGPETMSILELLQKFALYQGNKHFQPVFIDYRNLERIVNAKSLGNLNRQFISLLRSEQDTDKPIVGNPSIWNALPGEDGKPLITLDEAMVRNSVSGRKTFPYLSTLQLIWQYPKLIPPGIDLSLEILQSYFQKKKPH